MLRRYSGKSVQNFSDCCKSAGAHVDDAEPAAGNLDPPARWLMLGPTFFVRPVSAPVGLIEVRGVAGGTIELRAVGS